MSIKSNLFILSMGLNVCLLGCAVYLLKPRADASKPGGNAIVSEGRSARQGMERPAQSISTGFHWRQLESTDYRVYIANLRAAGCPEETVRDIIVAEVSKLYAPKFAAVQASARAPNYWERPRSPSPDTLTRQRELFAEKNALITALLGIDPDEENRKNGPAAHELDRRFGFLPENKREPLRILEDRYFDLERRIHAAANGLMTPDDRAALTVLRQQKAAEMDALLTPLEQLEYALRNSPAARQLQQELDAFQPSEAEFRAIYQAQAALEEKMESGRKEYRDGQTHGTGVEPEKEFDDHLNAALGERRYAEYRRSKDPGYRFLLKLADRYSLPREVASEVLNVKQGVEMQTRQLRANPQLNADQRKAWLQAVRDQTETKLASMLGEKGFSLYRDQGGSWIERIAQ